MLGGGLKVAMGDVLGGFKALPLSGAELWPQAMLSAEESSRGVGEKRKGVVWEKKAFLRLHSLVTRMLSWMWRSAPREARGTGRQ